MLFLSPNDAHHWRRANGVQYGTGLESRRPVHVPVDTAFIFRFFSEELYMATGGALQAVWLTQQSLGNPFP